MTLMLASMKTLEEAEVAIKGGVDIIDLGAVEHSVVRAAADAFNGRRMVCVDAGQFPSRAGSFTGKLRGLAATGANYVRIGIAPGVEPAACIAELASVASEVKLIAVFYGDAGPDFSLLPLLRRTGFAGAMIDTRTRRLLDHIGIAKLLNFVEKCHVIGLIAGFAGCLETPDIPRLLVLAPDLLGFDDALRLSNEGTPLVDLARVRAIRGLIPPEGAIIETNDVDDRMVSGRTDLPGAAEDVPVDLVFVEDFVLPVFIGAYAQERDKPQNVRFAVNASVIRVNRIAEGMRDVFSYDLITDAIRMLTGSGHSTFVETLAERIAAAVLGHPRVTKVVVRVQKLETGSGTVGVEIERRRSPRAMDRPAAPRLVEVGKTTAGQSYPGHVLPER